MLIAYVGMPPFVVTLAMLSFARSLAMVASNNTVVFQFGPDQSKLLFLGGGALLFGISNPVIYTIVLALVTGFTLRWTRFGRYVFAIGGNEKAAILTGVPVRRVKLAVYMISSLSAGVAGIIETGWLGAVTTNLGAGMELQVIAATVIGGANLAGGVGTAFGALIGSALIEVIRNSLGLLGISAFWQGAFVGAFFIIGCPRLHPEFASVRIAHGGFSAGALRRGRPQGEINAAAGDRRDGESRHQSHCSTAFGTPMARGRRQGALSQPDDRANRSNGDCQRKHRRSQLRGSRDARDHPCRPPGDLQGDA